jgi:CubicO group peptidase (beta-lactamase class C family)
MTDQTPKPAPRATARRWPRRSATPSRPRCSSAFSRKCRAEYADVLEVIGAAEGRTDQTGRGGAVSVYRAGERVVPHAWDDDWTKECAPGIHFYITKEEALAHQ